MDTSRISDHKFVVDLSQSELDDLHDRLEHARYPIDFNNDDWRMGVNREYLEALVAYWRHDYDWRAEEARINSFNQYKLDIEGMPIHFIVEPGVGPDPRPLILSHGWPWTFWDYHELIGPLSDPASHGGDAADAFDVIVPSSPGFGFSTPLKKTGMNFWRTADVWAELMCEVLGYEHFFAAGGDFGNLISAQLGHKYADVVSGIHITGAIPLGLFSGINPLGVPDWGFKQKEENLDNPHLVNPGVMRGRPQSAHVAVQTNEPQTVAYALNDSPAGMLAWLLQRRRWWSDNAGNVEDSFSRDFLITSAMIFWMSQSYSSSARYYAEAVDNPWQPEHDRNPVVEAPTGITFFDHDMTSQSRFWVPDYYNLHYLNSSDRGGHFAAAEQPTIVVDEIRKCFRDLR
ncbi:MAG: alpha/beta fold hydrolase [Gammaproteobacteria bacterium]|jgi:pimeloyl-ACP methyl ester carboxylesterase|nr:alpha/beta fold hydrolase [Gammaproteobacteria bacterium]MBT4494500.1 alpha/beta fold hydrolase [Gammaproteobacteria bacterium]